MKEKSIFEDEKKYFGLKTVFFICFHRSVHKVILEKKVFFEAFCSKSQVFAT